VPRKLTPQEIVRLRARMDRINAQLAQLLQRRARLALAIGRKKAHLALRAADPAREREMLANALKSAPPGFDRRELARIFRAVFAASRKLVVRDRRGAR
jgi:chorismate mutase